MQFIFVNVSQRSLVSKADVMLMEDAREEKVAQLNRNTLKLSVLSRRKAKKTPINMYKPTPAATNKELVVIRILYLTVSIVSTQTILIEDIGNENKGLICAMRTI